jgi:hypothetical protein
MPLVAPVMTITCSESGRSDAAMVGILPRLIECNVLRASKLR